MSYDKLDHIDLALKELLPTVLITLVMDYDRRGSYVRTLMQHSQDQYGVDTASLAVSDEHLFVGSSDGGKQWLCQMDKDHGGVTRRIQAGIGSMVPLICMAPSGTLFICSNRSMPYITLFQPSTGAHAAWSSFDKRLLKMGESILDMTVDSKGFVLQTTTGRFLRTTLPPGPSHLMWSRKNLHGWSTTVPAAVASDGQHIYVLDQGHQRLLVLSAEDGADVYSWSIRHLSGNDYFHFNRMAVDEAHVYLCDLSNHGIVVLDKRNRCERLDVIGSFGISPHMMRYPNGITVDEKYLYVHDIEGVRVFRK